jgi:hypothetical protein
MTKDKVLEVLQKYDIEYREFGKNVAKGNININCPFCSDGDTGFHLGINYKTGQWGCWRDAKHRGKSVVALLSKMLGISTFAARTELQEVISPDLDVKSLLEKIDKINTREQHKEIARVETLEFPDNFYRVEPVGTTIKFWQYLDRRGFNGIEEIISKYDLRCCFLDNFADRIIIPVYKDEKLVTWTSRHIYNGTPKYKDLSIVESVIPCKRLIYNYDNLTGGQFLFITEGPMDALKMDSYLVDSNATCLFTKTATPEQKYLLSIVAKRYETVFILLDPDAKMQSLSLADELSFIRNVRQLDMPEGIEDPGKFSPSAVVKFEKSLTM